MDYDGFMKPTTFPFERYSLLKQKLGAIVTDDTQECYRCSYDGMRVSFMPDAVIKVEEASQVGEVLRLANDVGVPVTVRGTGSSLTGSAAPINGGWVIDMSALNSIKIDREESMAHVGAGAVTGKIQEAAEKVGLFYAPDPASLKFCTIGGNIACNAGGLRGAKYGVTRDYIVALSGFLPTGKPVTWGRALRKFAVGYNLRDLWIGSEGTLGVVTSAVLRLIKKPQKRWTCLAVFPSEERALAAAQELRVSYQITPSIMEFLDRLTVEGAEKKTQQKLFDHLPGRSMLLIELDGHPAAVEEDEEKVKTWAAKYAEAFIHGKTDEEIERLWSIRRQCSSAMFQHGTTKLNEDVVVPLRSMVDLVHFIQEISAQMQLKIPTFGHAADGNLHVNIMYNHDDDVQRHRAGEALRAVMERVVQLGGAITGEHGLGLAKSGFLRLQYNKDEIDTMLAIKKALDPNNILNPGKIFTPFVPWEHKLEDVHLPWEKQEGKA